MKRRGGRSRRKVEPEVLQRLSEALASIESPESIATFLSELLTAGEVNDIALRWHLLEKLVQGATQRKIAEELGVSLCKITRGARILKCEDSVTARILGQTGDRQFQL